MYTCACVCVYVYANSTYTHSDIQLYMTSMVCCFVACGFLGGDVLWVFYKSYNSCNNLNCIVTFQVALI